MIQVRLEQITDLEGLIFELIVPVMALGSYFWSYKQSSKQLKSVKPRMSLAQKLQIFKTSQLVKWKFTAGSALFASFAYGVTGRNNLLLYALMLSVLMIYQRPLKSRAIEELRLSEDETDKLLDE